MLDGPIERNIRRLASISVVGFLIVAAALGYWQFFRAGDLYARGDNPRLLDDELRTQRGKMLDRTGKPMVDNLIGSGDYAQRRYLVSSLAPVSGYISPRYGSTGLESAFDDYLAGRSGLTPERIVNQYLFGKPAVGNDVVLTIDSRIQEIAARALGQDRGAVVALNPRTGEVLAMVSSPTFDPNDLAFNPNAPKWSAERGRIDANWQKLVNAGGSPLLNRATQGAYTPGSTFKTVTLATALELGLVTPGTRYHIELRPPDATHPAPWHANQFTEDMNQPNTDFDLGGAFAWSDNVVFSDLGAQIGPERYVDAARRFGLEEAPPFELPVEASRLYNSPEFFHGPNRVAAVATTAFGQGQLSVTPLQMALVTAAVANGGAIPRPYVVSEVRDARGGVLFQRTPSTWKVAMPANVASTVRDLMVRSVDEGWAKTGAVKGMKVAGKTGTAETGPGKPTHAWYIGFAPADNPKVAVAVIKEFAGGGSVQAGPVAKAIFEAVGG